MLPASDFVDAAITESALLGQAEGFAGISARDIATGPAVAQRPAAGPSITPPARSTISSRGKLSDNAFAVILASGHHFNAATTGLHRPRGGTEATHAANERQYVTSERACTAAFTMGG